MADLQLPEKGAQRGELEGVGAGSQERPFKPAPLAQTTHSLVFIKENIKVLRRMIKEHYQQAKTKGTPKKLAYDESEEGDSASRGTKGMSEQLSLGSSSTSGAHDRVRSSVKGQRSLSHGKTTSQPRSEEDSKYSCEDLSTPYKRPKPTPFTTRITRFKYYRRAKILRNIKVHEWNKDPEDHLSIFSAAAELEEWLMPVWCKMFCQTLGGASRNWFDDLDLKSVDNFEELSQKFLEEFLEQKRYAKDPMEIHGIKRRQNEGLQAFMDRFKFESSHIKGVPLVLRISAFMYGYGHPERAKKFNDKIPNTVDEMFERVRAFIRGEIAAVSAEATRPHSGTKGHNTNDCYQLKKQIEEVVASRKLVHLVKDIRRGTKVMEVKEEEM
ncbi:reverse transcriptase domain-containing protein [Tanacetum coccineum]|uniref:Reverse transcriptase domain-containing protein n=1 Tax=Tanacetum coccineum TaxID=301880 RepID=A0ABQ4X2I7_9ASTR